MRNLDREHINDRRELNKMSLDTFLFDKVNILDFPIDKSLDSINNEIEKIHKELCEINESTKKHQDLSDRYEEYGGSLWELEHSLVSDMQYYQDEVYVLYEVKIIYAYKHLEINLKKLLSSAYNDSSAKKIYNWRDFSQYLSLKNIELKDVEFYKEVNELREVNNALKHSGEINSDFIKKIDEFKNKTFFINSDLEKFYNRVKNSPNNFLNSLVTKISQNLYSFDEERLETIAKHFALRMDENIAKKFCEILINTYK